MNTSSGTTLPSIHSLSLDLPPLDAPGKRYQPYQQYQQYQPYGGQNYPYLPFPNSISPPPHSLAQHQINPQFAPQSFQQLVKPAPLAQDAAHVPTQNHYHTNLPINGSNSPLSDASSSQPQVVDAKPLPHSPIASPYRENSVESTESFNYRHRSMSDPVKNEENEEDEIGSTTSGSPHPSPILESSEIVSKKNWKPRKKRQCPECKLYFSNLATHKSTHLKPTSRPHICKYCNRGFARPNDLFRHVKCHWKEIGSDKGQFKCPFKNLEPHEASETDAHSDHCCHNTGIFSRCDTFKNHLKAIHFQYPNGTKKDQRTKVAGKCRMCYVDFKNVDDWMTNHIEKNMCPNAINMIKKE